jgi:outer membrane protein assembly factor BamB
VVDGTLFVGADDGRLYALDSETGVLRWATEPAGSAFWSSPAILDGTVYIGSLDHHLYAFNAFSGDLRWKKKLDYRIHGSPSIANGVVYIATDEGEKQNLDARFNFHVYAVDASSGDTLWSSTECQGSRGVGTDSNVILAEGALIVQNEQGYICAFTIDVP